MSEMLKSIFWSIVSALMPDGKQPVSDQPQQPIFEEPQCLVETGQDEKLHVNEAVIEQLQQLDGQLVVVAIAGLYRTGKSYLMNRLAGKNTGFALGSTIESETKGIWIWIRPHPRLPDTYLVLLDTEGLGDAEQGDANYDNWIFTLSVLLSSTFVYNYLGAINDDMITKLNFVSEISKKMKMKASDREGEDAEFDLHFPVFIMALRDFCLELEINGQKVTADEYLENFLILGKARRPEFIESRRCIRKYFKTRKCFTFDRPTTTRRQLKDLETLKDHELNKDFLDDSKAFTDYVFTDCPIMKLPNGTKLTGPMFAFLVGTYVTSIREGDLPCVQNAFTMMAEQVNRKALEGAILHYRELVEARVDLPTETEQELYDINFHCQKEAIVYFTSKVIMDKDSHFLKSLTEELFSVYMSYVEKNRDLSREKCQKLLDKLDASMQQKYNEGFYTAAGGFPKFKKDLETVTDAYKKHTGLGVEKDKMLDDYINATAKTSAIIAAADVKMTELEKKIEDLKQLEFRVESQKKQHDDEMKQMRQLYEGKVAAIEETMIQMKEKQGEEMKTLVEQEAEIQEKRIEERERLLKEGFKKEAEEMRTEIEHSKTQFEEMKLEMANSKAEFKDQLQKQKEGLNMEEAERMRSELEETKIQHEEMLKKQTAIYKEELKKLEVNGGLNIGEVEKLRSELVETKIQHEEMLKKQTAYYKEELKKLEEKMGIWAQVVRGTYGMASYLFGWVR